jgi:hypothetical protein
MKRTAIILMTAIVGISATAFADVKVKTKQTMSGQVSEMTSYIKGKRQRTEMMNGMMVSITQCDLGRDLQLNSQVKTYLANYFDDGTAVPQAKPSTQKTSSVEVTKGGTMTVTTTIKDTGERKQMFGYTARHIFQTIETESSPDACSPVNTKMQMDMWVIDAEFGLACAMTRSYRPNGGTSDGGCKDRIQQKTIGTARAGYPIYQKMASFDGNGKESFTMVQEVVEISKATLDASLFEAPADYREVKNTTDLYAVAANAGRPESSVNSNPSLPSTRGQGSEIVKSANNQGSKDAAVLGPKKPGTVRVGLAGVKTVGVGEGISASDLAAAVRNSLAEFLKGTKVEVVNLEAKLASAQADEGKQKECDFIVYSNVSHKKGGGGGFGLGKMLAHSVAQTGVLGSTGSVAGNIAGNVASQAIITAASLSSNVKKKDEVTLDVKLQSPDGAASPLAKQFKAKAQSDGDDIISAIVEQAAEALVAALGL